MSNSAATDNEYRPSGSWQIRFEDLTLGYDNHVVLDKINAALPGGRISMILGSSGGGKSTLLRHMVGLRKPMSGRILLGDFDLFNLPEKSFRALRRRMGMLFQDGALLGSMNLADNIALPLYEHTKLDQQTIGEVVLHTLEMVGMADFGHYYPNELSGGMRKRAGLARAMVTSPPILLCDEPTSGLDPINSAQMDDLLLELKAQNPAMTIVVVSHDIQSLFKIADHALVLNKGGIAFNGPVKELKSTEDPFLKEFLSRSAKALAEQTQRHALSPETRQKVQNAVDKWIRND
ncbi:ATP-binding cassette domain-containing protein [Desulfovibrio sp. OttesenSCG-928-C14]|nr:ATP-binding cassette domain-containing protein [Desulfovibrio sp. OttesenSCG-928-C14]